MALIFIFCNRITTGVLLPLINFVATCGDSFACGAGMPKHENFEKSFGGLTADYLQVPQRVIARSGCCNYAIWLQVKHVVKEWSKEGNPFVIISITNSARTTWYKPFAEPSVGEEPTIQHLNYEDYEPYSKHTPEEHRRTIPVQTDNIMQSETLQNLDSFFDSSIKATWPQMEHEPNARLKVLKDWVAGFFNFEIKQEYDNAILLNAHCLLKQAGIPHVFMGWQPDLQNLLPKENYVGVDWGWWSQRYPDPQGTGHCDEHGHREVFKQIKSKVEVQCK
jgi:hypothetical protein